MVAPVRNPEPITVIKVGFPASMLDGVTEEMTGARFWSASGKVFEIPLDGDGF